LRRGPHLHEALLVAGKLVRRGRINAVAPGRLVHIVDETSQRRFLVDTGAAYSIFPYSSPGKQSGPCLTGADGLHIPCWGERRLTLSFHGRLFVWPFLLAKVQFPIIGVDFLRHFKLLVDPAANRLVDTVSTQLLPTQPARTSRDLGGGRCHTCRASRRITGARHGSSPRLSAWLQPERPARQGCDRRRR